ncbi:MAG: ComEC/Rec2 family competence protein [Armatimonadetes bacterium]|nr:ComEC/Rec2 family competence protein [Armatimonadota bacterium]
MFNELRRRPLFVFFIGLLVGISFPAVSWLSCVGVGAGWTVRRYWIATVSLGILVGGLLVGWRTPAPPISAGEVHERVEIRSFPDYQKGKAVYAFRTLGAEARTGVLRVDPSVVLSPFAVADVQGMAAATKSGSLTTDQVRVVSRWAVFDWLVQLQKRAIAGVNDAFGVEDGAWVTALTFNFPSDLSADEKSDLRYNGTFHMVSASGVHVFVLAAALQFLLVGLGVRRAWQVGLVTTLLMIYCCLTGFHAPTVRASLMWLVGSSAYLFRRSSDGLSSLCLAALVWLFFVPSDIFTAGFQLSFLVSGFLLMYFDRHRAEPMPKLRSVVMASLVATVAAEPLCAWWFGRIVFVGVLSNLLIEFPSSAVMVLGYLSLIPFVGRLFALVAYPLIWWIKLVTLYTAQAPCLLVYRHAVSPWAYLAYYAFWLWYFLGRPVGVKEFE